MTTPKRSLFGFLSEEGRLNNLWVRARNEKDPDHRIVLMRQVLQKLKDKPVEWFHYWDDLFPDILGEPQSVAITDADLESLEELCVLGSQQPTLCDEMWQYWHRLVDAHDGLHGKKDSTDFLTRVYNLPTVDNTTRTECANELAKRGAQGDTHFDVYVDWLKKNGARSGTPVYNRVSDLLDISFDSDQVRIKRSAKLAKRIVDENILIRGVDRALGISVLLVEHDPKRALRIFQQAAKEKPRDEVTQIGVLSCVVQLRDHASLNSMVPEIERSDNPVIRDLVALGRAQSWLDLVGSESRSPVTAEQLARIAPRPLFGDALDQTVARMSLVEGDTQKGLTILQQLSHSPSRDPSVYYYLIWASQLHEGSQQYGDLNRNLSYVVQLLGGAIPWHIAAQIIDAEQGYAEKKAISFRSVQSDSGYVDAIEKRGRVLQLSTSQETLPDWKKGSGTPEEEIEAYRSALGYACYQKNPDQVRALIGSDYFFRLPYADRLTWGGVCSILEGDHSGGRELLETAIASGYVRAGYILGVHLLNGENPAATREYFSKFFSARPNHPKSKLLMYYLDAIEGNFQKASEQLDTLDLPENPRVLLNLGNTTIRQAYDASMADLPQLSSHLQETAARILQRGIDNADGSDPTADTLKIALNGLAALSADPRSLETLCDSAPSLSKVDGERWLEWLVAVAWIWHGTMAQKTIAGDHVVHLLGLAPNVNHGVVLSLINTILFNQLNCSHPESYDELFKFIAGLEDSVELKRIVETSAIVRDQARLYTSQEGKVELHEAIIMQARSNPGTGPYAFFAAEQAFKRGSTEAVGEILGRTNYEDPFMAALGLAVRQMVMGDTPVLDEIVPLMKNTPRDIQTAYLIVRALAEFGTALPKQGYETLNRALSQDPANVSRIIGISQFLPGICSSSAKGGVPVPMARDLVRQLADTSLDAAGSLTLIRCAGLLGDHDLAVHLWKELLQRDQPLDPQTLREFVAYTCFLSVQDYSRGDLAGAAEKLDSIVQYLGQEGENATAHV